MTFRHSAARTVGFAALYLLATYAGRLTVMDATNLSLVWPAAGILSVWFVVQRGSRWRWLDALSLAVITMIVNMMTGASAALALFFVVANLVQGFAFAFFAGRWLPSFASGRNGVPALARLRELWRLIAAAGIATCCGALIGPAGVWLISGTYSWQTTIVWLTRNTVSILLVGVAALRVGHVFQQWWFRRQEPGAGTAWWRSLPAVKRLEYAALIGCSLLAYCLAFGLGDGLPVAFAVISMTVWAGLRLHTTFVVLHDLSFGTIAILFTLHGDGPFAMIESHAVRALIAQLFVGTVAVVGLALALSRDERDLLTMELREQAQLMTTIVDTLSEGISVVDEHGAFLLRNPAVGELLGGVTSKTGQVGQADYYGLYHPDGKPMTDEELPYRKVFAGENPPPTDILIRNAGVPGGRVINLVAKMLPDQVHGVRQAVVAFHDVTADRRHRDELANFAGVVAHDLLNPLATIDGWSELMEQDLDDPEHPVAAGIPPIRRASARMRALINDLLAYTTSRDANLSPAVLDLDHLVTEITTVRIDQAQSTGQPVPVFHARGLGTVEADPVLVRQLFDNLISNAIKYTAAGVTPAITISAAPETTEPGLVRVEIADNGIGIPAGEHDAVFGNFHRAHRADGYAGTGLGLAICRRIVERHGGTIGAADNPAGAGTRVVFTLPRADRGAPTSARDRSAAATTR